MSVQKKRERNKNNNNNLKNHNGLLGYSGTVIFPHRTLVVSRAHETKSVSGGSTRRANQNNNTNNSNNDNISVSNVLFQPRPVQPVSVNRLVH